jgi:hypothetical protein
MSENVGASASRNPRDLHGLYREKFTFLQISKLYNVNDGMINKCVAAIIIITFIIMALQPFVWPWPLFQFLDPCTQSVETLGRGISRPQGLYLHKNTE